MSQKRQHPGIECPTCGADTRVIHTDRDGNAITRIRLCTRRHISETHEPVACPNCEEGKSWVLNTRNLIDRIVRERCCKTCQHRFKTTERAK
jgi:transcriptional regulator NrdR family protein